MSELKSKNNAIIKSDYINKKSYFFVSVEKELRKKNSRSLRCTKMFVHNRKFSLVKAIPLIFA